MFWQKTALRPKLWAPVNQRPEVTDQNCFLTIFFSNYMYAQLILIKSKRFTSMFAKKWLSWYGMTLMYYTSLGLWLRLQRSTSTCGSASTPAGSSAASSASGSGSTTSGPTMSPSPTTWRPGGYRGIHYTYNIHYNQSLASGSRRDFKC